MKTKLLALALAGVFAFSGAIAQEQGDMRAGLGLVIGTVAKVDDSGDLKMGFGLAPSFEYVVADAISANASYDWYFKSSVGGTDISISSFNIDGRYYFVTGDTQVYGLLGVAFMRSKAESGGISVTTSETGLNIGAGAIFGLSDNMGVNLQAKYQTPKFAEPSSGDEKANLAINAGLVFTF